MDLFKGNDSFTVRGEENDLNTSDKRLKMLESCSEYNEEEDILYLVSSVPEDSAGNEYQPVE